MNEKVIQTLFSKVIETDRNVAYELKLEKGKSMPFKAVRDDQIKALKAVKSTGLYHKIQDFPYSSATVRFAKAKSFDCFTLKGEAYIGICFYEPRKPKEVILIDIDDFVKEMDKSKRKSLTKQRSVEISTRIIKI
jgi:penicillin-binding protein-related factor A (putative recombinase)